MTRTDHRNTNDNGVKMTLNLLAHPRSRRTNRLLAGACLLAIGVSATACGGSDRAAQDPKARPSAASTVPSGDNGNLANPVGAIRSLSRTSCKAAADGTWAASGELTNSTADAATYLVTFSVVKTKTSEVLASRTLTRDLKPGASTAIEVKDLYTSDAKGLSCVPRVVAGSEK
ncbi:hypothetical protein [Marmoricola sp. RAF53]|uniref:hypothetical protein n=1 Tax=Marmoricola sp. RAF53 TaxID=3233059 RepID=UPI003F9A833D